MHLQMAQDSLHLVILADFLQTLTHLEHLYTALC